MTLEELLNKLIEKGWKVYHRNYNKCVNVWRNCAYFMYRDEYGRPKSDIFFSLRELCAKESGLWQFVCENGMVALKLSARMKNPRIDWEDVDDYNNGHIVMNYKQKCEGDKAEYRLIESTLSDEDKLEQFLLDNIKL